MKPSNASEEQEEEAAAAEEPAAKKTKQQIGAPNKKVLQGKESQSAPAAHKAAGVSPATKQRFEAVQAKSEEGTTY